MNRIVLGMLAVAVIVLSRFATGDSAMTNTPPAFSADDESAVRALVNEFANTWNQHDMKAMHELDTENVEWMLREQVGTQSGDHGMSHEWTMKFVEHRVADHRIFQSEFGESFPKRLQELLGFLSVFETDHQVVGITDGNRVSRSHLPAPGFDPSLSRQLDGV